MQHSLPNMCPRFTLIDMNINQIHSVDESFPIKKEIMHNNEDSTPKCIQRRGDSGVVHIIMQSKLLSYKQYSCFLLPWVLIVFQITLLLLFTTRSCHHNTVMPNGNLHYIIITLQSFSVSVRLLIFNLASSLLTLHSLMGVLTSGLAPRER